MRFFALFILEIFCLFFLSQLLTKSLSKIFLTITKSQNVTIQILSILFLPGVVIHELSHLLIAGILFVRTGEIEFTPKFIEGGVKLGSVAIGKTDPIRRAIIGFAPVFVGLMLIISIVYFFSSNILFFKDRDYYIFAGAVLGVIYLLFAISNTMFSSSRDMQGTVEILITLLIIFIAAYIIGFRPPLSFAEKIFTGDVIEVVKKPSLFLLAPIAIDIVLLGVIKIIQNLKVKSQKYK